MLMTNTPDHGIRYDYRQGEVHTTRSVVLAFEGAGATLLAMPRTGYTPTMAAAASHVVHNVSEAYGYTDAPLRPARPSAAQIDRMDEVFAWLRLIPQEQHMLRRIVTCRSLVRPVTGIYLYSWRRLADLLDMNRRTVVRRHADGIEIIVSALNRGMQPERFSLDTVHQNVAAKTA